MYKVGQITVTGMLALGLSFGIAVADNQTGGAGSDRGIQILPGPAGAGTDFGYATGISNGDFEDGFYPWTGGFTDDSWGQIVAVGQAEVITDDASTGGAGNSPTLAIPSFSPAPTLPPAANHVLRLAVSATPQSGTFLPDPAGGAGPTGIAGAQASGGSTGLAPTGVGAGGTTARLSASQQFRYADGHLLATSATVAFGLTLTPQSYAGFTVTMELNDLSTGASTSQIISQYQTDWPCDHTMSLDGLTGWQESMLVAANITPQPNDLLEVTFTLDLAVGSTGTGPAPTAYVAVSIDDVQLIQGGPIEAQQANQGFTFTATVDQGDVFDPAVDGNPFIDCGQLPMPPVEPATHSGRSGNVQGPNGVVIDDAGNGGSWFSPGSQDGTSGLSVGRP
ncbi:MAG: hypothetical protein ACE5F9_10550 [Phycisphaerae bacterium]